MECVNNFIAAEPYAGVRRLSLITEISSVKKRLNSEVNVEDPDKDLVSLMVEHLDSAKALYK